MNVHSDGSLVFIERHDEVSEKEMRDLLAATWKCSIVTLPKLSPLDCYVCRDERIMAWVELRRRYMDFGTYPTVFINVDKYEHLMSWELGTGILAFFVVHFDDALCWIKAEDIDQTRRSICHRRDKNEGRDEEVIEIPLEEMKVRKL